MHDQEIRLQLTESMLRTGVPASSVVETVAPLAEYVIDGKKSAPAPSGKSVRAAIAELEISLDTSTNNAAVALNEGQYLRAMQLAEAAIEIRNALAILRAA